MMKKSVRIIGIFSILVVSNAAFAKVGVRDGGGGDYSGLSKFADLKSHSESAVHFYRNSFVSLGLKGLEELEPLAWIGYEFKSPSGQVTTLNPSSLRVARKILLNLLNKNQSGKFLLDENLKNPKTGEPRIAFNSPRGFFRLNPNEWGKKLDESHQAPQAEKIRMSIAVHEALSQPEVGLESTGNFTYSSVLLRAPELDQAQKRYQVFLSALFQSSEHGPFFYSCDMDLYEKKEGRFAKIWRTPIPIRTYLKWSIAPGHLDELEGKPVLVNPNFVLGTSSNCLSMVLSDLGLVKPHVKSNDVLKFLPKVSSEHTSYLDVCYVIGDSAPGSEYPGGARVLLRKIDSNDATAWHRFNYVTPELTLKGQQTQSLEYENYRLDVSCALSDSR